MKTRDIYFTPGGVLMLAEVVDRRMQYHAKIMNAGLNRTAEYRDRYERGVAFKARTGLLSAQRVERGVARVVSAFDWTPTHPRPDAPPSPRGSAAA